MNAIRQATMSDGMSRAAAATSGSRMSLPFTFALLSAGAQRRTSSGLVNSDSLATAQPDDRRGEYGADRQVPPVRRSKSPLPHRTNPSILVSGRPVDGAAPNRPSFPSGAQDYPIG